MAVTEAIHTLTPPTVIGTVTHSRSQIAYQPCVITFALNAMETQAHFVTVHASYELNNPPGPFRVTGLGYATHL